MLQAINMARTLGYKRVYLDTISTSKDALNLYRKAGFVETDRYNDNNHADAFMVMDLMP